MTNHPRVFQAAPTTPFPKDGINDYIVNGRMNTVNPAQEGTKAAAHYQFSLGPGETATLRLRLSSSAALGRPSVFGKAFDDTMALRLHESHEVYNLVVPSKVSRARHGVGGGASRDAAGARGPPGGEGVLPLRRPPMAQR